MGWTTIRAVLLSHDEIVLPTDADRRRQADLQSASVSWASGRLTPTSCYRRTYGRESYAIETVALRIWFSSATTSVVDPAARFSASSQIKFWILQISAPSAVLDRAETLTVHCDVFTVVPSESDAVAGAAVTVSVGVLPHVALIVSVSAPTVACVPFESVAVNA